MTFWIHDQLSMLHAVLYNFHLVHLSFRQGPQLSSLFIYPGAFATSDSAQLTAWCNAALGRHPAVGSSATDTIVDPNLLAPPHRKSEPRPPHDCDVNLSSSEDNVGLEARQRKGPMRVVADSFEELVVQSNTSVLLELANDCTRATYCQTAVHRAMHVFVHCQFLN
jgi:hypothetical protein